MASCEPRSYSSLSPLRNKIRRAGESFSDFDNRSNEILIQQKITQQQLEIQKPNPVELFLLRMCDARDHIFWKRLCSNCSKDFESDKEGKPIIHTDLCCIPYCKDLECYTFRVCLAKLILRSYFYVFPTWRENRQRWLHIILGKKRIKKITSSTLSDFRKDIMKVLNYLRKEYRDPHMICIFDIAHNGETFYLHYHVAMRIRGHMKEKEINEFALKNNLKYKRAEKGYSRKPKPLINYFAQRLAGKFEHDQNETSWCYADLFSVEEYLNLFYRKKRFLTRGFDSKQVKEIRKKIKEGLLNPEGILSSNNTNNGIRKTCQYCDCKDFKRIYVEDPNKRVIPPPDYSKNNGTSYNPPINKSKIVVIKIK